MPERSTPAILAFLVAGCGGAVPPPAPPPPPAPAPPPIATAAKSAEAPPPAPPPSSAPAAPASPPRTAERLPGLTRRFVTFTLPGVKGSLISVHGSGSKDIWFLSSEPPDTKKQFIREIGVGVHFDGARGVRVLRNECWGAVYSSIHAHRGGALLQGGNPFARSYVGTAVTSTLRPDGKMDCGNLGPSPRVSSSSGDRTWRLVCKTNEGGLCTLASPDGPAAALPSFDGSAAAGDATPLGVDVLWMRGLDDGWITAVDPRSGERALLRYNGVTWVPRAKLRAGLVPLDVWADAEGHPWITAQIEGDGAPRSTLLRFDGQALQEMTVPEDFAAKWVTGTGPSDVWFFEEGTKAYQWDGKTLHEGELPFAYGGAWGAPGGEVWIVGRHGEWGDDVRPGELGHGTAAHTAPLPAGAP